MRILRIVAAITLGGSYLTFPQDVVNFHIGYGGTLNALQVDQVGRMHVAWADHAYSLLDQQGQPILDSVSFTSGWASSDPDIGINSARAIFVWRLVTFTMNDLIQARTYAYSDSSFSSISGIQDSYGDATRFSPKIAALSDSVFLVVWSGNGRFTPMSSGIYGQFITERLELLGQNLYLSDDTLDTRSNASPRIAIDTVRRRIAIVSRKGNSMGNQILARWFTTSAVPLGPSIAVSTDTSGKYCWGHSVVSAPDGSFLVGWSTTNANDTCDLFLRRFDADGSPVGIQIHVNSSPAAWASEAEVAMDSDGTCLVAWESSDPWRRIVAQRFDANLNKMGSQITLSSSADTVHQNWPLVRLSHARIYAAWVHGNNEVRGSITDFNYPPVSVASDQRDPFTPITLESYPNPFNSSTILKFGLPWASRATVAVYDLLGRSLFVLRDGHFDRGTYSVTWNAGSLPSGLYFVRLSTNGRMKVQKVLLLR